MKKLYEMIAIFGKSLSAMLKPSYDSITVDELNQRRETNKKTVVLDVRTPGEFDGPYGHIKGAVLIPLQTLGARVDELEKYRNQEIYVICLTGRRSGTATKFLNATGYRATNVSRGMVAWNRRLAS